ncbi:MAG: lysylphosphatidylglycerol synthase transmembrane domain-containing protein [Candidatus Omnitrophota bacterium]|nr:lysylphosphatidylglycerol synthase transmembrane domain-containing protein [Candidatus Omnitrophota bacterium]
MKYGFGGVFVRLTVSVTAIGLTLYILRDKLDEALHIMAAGVRWDWFALAMLAYILCQGILALRLRTIFHGQDIQIRFLGTFYLCLIGNFFNLILPSAVGGDVAKAYYCYKRCGKKIEATTSVIIDRLTGFFSLMLIALAALGFLHREIKDPRISMGVYGFLGLIFLLSLFFINKKFARIFKFLTYVIPERFRTHLSEAYHAIHSFQRRKKNIAAAILLSLVGQVFLIFIAYWLARSLGVAINPMLFFVLMPVISIVSMAPSMGGLGVREVGSVYLFSRYMPSETALALSLLLDILIYGFSLSAGVIYALRGELKAETIHQMEALE